MKKIKFIGHLNIEFAEAKKAPKSLTAKRVKANQFLLMKKLDGPGGIKTSRKWSRSFRQRNNNSQEFGLLDKFKTKEQIAKEIESGERNTGQKLWKKKAEERAKKEADFVAEVQRKSEQVKREIAEKNLKLKQASRLKGRLGLGAVGLLAASAVGYGVYRKMRKDKGRKRGNYRK